MTTNKIFANNLTLNNAELTSNSVVSKVRVNREYLISQEIASELNTYVSFDPFPTFNDLFAPEYNAKGDDVTPDKKGSGTPGVRSIFNKAGAVIIGDTSTTNSNIITKKASEFRISNNVPLIDNRDSRKAIRENSGCTVKELVEASQQGLLGRETYSYSDFMYCKYLGRISNNYMVTLRRFPYPVDDFISSLGEGETRKNSFYTSYNTDSIGCMVTWMGTPGNDMANILKYSVSMPFKEQSAQLDTSPIDADSNKGLFNEIAAAFDPAYRQQYMDGQAGTNMNNLFRRFAPIAVSDPPYRATEWNNFMDKTKAYGPVDVVKLTHIRGDSGLDFQQTISLTFDYELRSYNGINPRQAMLDLISNILNVTYSTGTFWGGGYRGGGAHQNNIFTNLQMFKKNTRGFAGYVDAFTKDYSTISKSVENTINNNGGIMETLKKMANTLGGMLIAGVLNGLGRPHKAAMNSILSPAPVGFWHVTIGNPHHPIMSIGNMILSNTSITHYGPLGLDDFPTNLKVVCELKRAKSRDIRDIEKLYMHGNDRIYTSMGPKIFDMYEHSKEYRGKNGKVKSISSYNSGNPNTDANAPATKIAINDMDAVLMKYFGNNDRESIKIVAMEQENGSNSKPKKGTAGGDSSAQGNR